MARNAHSIGFLFTATDMVSATMRRMGANFDKTMRSMGHQTRDAHGRFVAFNKGVDTMKAGIAGMAMVGTAALGMAGALNLANAAGNFEMGMAQVAAISGIAVDSQDALMLSTVALDAALKTKFSPREAADGLANFASQGFTAKQQAEALVPALRLAQAGMIGVEESSAAMTSALKVFGIESGRAGEVTDKLLKIANLTSLSAGDLELALGTVGRGASAAKQDIDEMLISMGLVKNTGVDASVAASSVSSALIFMANNAEDFQKNFGVSVTDSQGKFRDFIDVVMDTELAFADKFDDEAERVKASAELYGKFGLTAFQAVSTQINNGITTATGGILKGEEAVKYLRNTMKNAVGEAEIFEAKLLGTFEGQKDLLKGVVEGMAVAMGQPFLAVFKPMVTNVRMFAESIVDIINAIPPGTKEVLAKITLGVLGLVGAIGLLIALKAGIQLAGMAMTYLGVSTTVAMAPLLIAVGVIAALGLAFAAFQTRSGQLKNGLGGIFEIGEKISLFWRGLVQMFKSGELSGEVLDELNKAENAGVKTFLGKVVDLGNWLMEFFDGVKVGFKALVGEAQPVFDEFMLSMGELGEAVATFTGGTTGSIVELGSAAQSRGQQIGQGLGRAAILAVQALILVTKIVILTLSILDGLGISLGTAIKMWIAFKVAVAMSTAIQAVPVLMAGISTAMGVFTTAAAGATAVVPALAASMTTLSASAAGFAAILMGPVGLVLGIGALVAALVYLADQKFGFSDELANWAGELTGLNDELERLNQLNGGLTGTRGFGGENPFQAGRTGQMAAEAGMGVEEYQQKRINELSAEGWDARVNPETGDIEVVGKAKPAAGAPTTAATASPARVEAAAAAGVVVAPDTGEMDQTSAQIAALSAEIDKMSKRPIQVAINVDSEKIAEATARGEANQKGRAFAPMPAEG